MPAIEVWWDGAEQLGEADGDVISVLILDTRPEIAVSFCDYKHDVFCTAEQADAIAEMFKEAAKQSRCIASENESP